MFALDGPNGQVIRRLGGDKEGGILTTVICLPVYIYRALKLRFTYVRTKVLKGLPADSVKRQVDVGALGF